MFNGFKKNVYSQNGEDGILQELLKKLNLEKNGWCCEFGAWDGKVGSNTFNLIKNFNFKAIYIESDEKKFKDLKKTERNYPNIFAINQTIDKNKNSIRIRTTDDLRRGSVNTDGTWVSAISSVLTTGGSSELHGFSPRVICAT